MEKEIFRKVLYYEDYKDDKVFKTNLTKYNDRKAIIKLLFILIIYCYGMIELF